VSGKREALHGDLKPPELSMTIPESDGHQAELNKIVTDQLVLFQERLKSSD
jgi:hypothetical protein